MKCYNLFSAIFTNNSNMFCYHKMQVNLSYVKIFNVIIIIHCFTLEAVFEKVQALIIKN